MSDLTPIERMALEVGWSQVRRGEAMSPHIPLVCVAALARLEGLEGAKNYEQDCI